MSKSEKTSRSSLGEAIKRAVFGPKQEATGRALRESLEKAAAQGRARAMETAKCPKCRKDARRTGMTKEKGKLVKHMVCGTCGHKFRAAL